MLDGISGAPSSDVKKTDFPSIFNACCSHPGHVGEKLEIWVECKVLNQVLFGNETF